MEVLNGPGEHRLLHGLEFFDGLLDAVSDDFALDGREPGLLRLDSGFLHLQILELDGIELVIDFDFHAVVASFGGSAPANESVHFAPETGEDIWSGFLHHQEEPQLEGRTAIGVRELAGDGACGGKGEPVRQSLAKPVLFDGCAALTRHLFFYLRDCHQIRVHVAGAPRGWGVLG